MVLYPFLFQPNLRPMVWGGNRIRPYKGLEPTDEPIGESWEVSTYPTRPSVISNGMFAGRLLASVIEETPDAILGKAVNKKYKGQFPLLVKFIDAKTDLSIQVHPNDEMAMREHGGMGKTEIWYVIKADEGGKLYSGFKKQITQEEYRQRIADDSITEVLAEHYVKPGDVFYIPAGRVHAICGGILLAEVQQSSDLTYRIYDYNRLGLDGKPRELHTELASRALNYQVEENYRTDYKDDLDTANEVISSPFFDVCVLELTKPMHRNMLNYDSFVISMCFEGDCKICVRSTGDEIVLKEGNSALIPAAIADYDVTPLTSKTRILEAFINNKENTQTAQMINFEISNHGAELQSLRRGDREYLWQGDPKYWGRRAPILFPIVGRLAGDILRIDGKEHLMSQHGFARDTDFAPVKMKPSLSGGTIVPHPNEEKARHLALPMEQRDNYPYIFDLSVDYEARGSVLSCEWKVTNHSGKDMHFQIGAHPAFNLPDYNSEDAIHGYLMCQDANGNVITPVVKHFLKEGLRHKYERDRMVTNDENLIPITNNSFADDAILIEDGQVACVILLDKAKNRVLSVMCPQADAFGLWAPFKVGCPFVCIEPWCGIADDSYFCGDISEREYNYRLNPGNTFYFNYLIQIY